MSQVTTQNMLLTPLLPTHYNQGCWFAEPVDPRSDKLGASQCNTTHGLYCILFLTTVDIISLQTPSQILGQVSKNMFWTEKTIAWLEFPLDDVHVAPINMTIHIILSTIAVITIMFIIFT